MTKYAGRAYAILYINASIVQGSGLGPTAFAITASDLKTFDTNNLLSKFANGTYLIVGSSRHSDISAEMNNISKQAENNNLRLNARKLKEVIISRRKYDKQPTQKVAIKTREGKLNGRS